MERHEHALCSHIILEPLFCMASPWSMICLLWSGALHLYCPTSAHCRLLERDCTHIVLLASLTSHIYRRRRESFYHHHCCILFCLYLSSWSDSLGCMSKS
jgi:hypothetical protein